MMMDNYKYVDGLIDSVHVRTSRRPYYTQFVDAEYINIKFVLSLKNSIVVDQKNTPFYVRRRRNPCGYGGDGGPKCDPCKWKKTKNEYFSTQKKKIFVYVHVTER